MKRILYIILSIIFIMCLAGCGKSEFDIVYSNKTVKPVELKLPGELERKNVELLSFDGRYGIFNINREFVDTDSSEPKFETAEIVVYDTVKEKTVMYKAVDMHRGTVTDAFYRDGGLYYIETYPYTEKQYLCHTDSRSLARIYVSTDSKISLGTDDDFIFFTVEEKLAEDNYSVTVNLLEGIYYRNVYRIHSNTEYTATNFDFEGIIEDVKTEDGKDNYRISHWRTDIWEGKVIFTQRNFNELNKDVMYLHSPGNRYMIVGENVYGYIDEGGEKPVFKVGNCRNHCYADVEYTDIEAMYTDGRNTAFYYDNGQLKVIKGSGLELVISDVSAENITDIKVCGDSALLYKRGTDADRLYLVE